MRRRVSAAMAALVLATLLVVAGTASPAAACRPVIRHHHATCGPIASYAHHQTWWVHVGDWIISGPVR